MLLCLHAIKGKHGERKVVAAELIATPMAPGISDGLGQWPTDGIDKATPLARMRGG
jgi:hypothetical protein